ncbi:MAG: hypothetical protein KUG73_07770, partial [Pseudomonadales bacterium]|nr:hypothetical protein [Pseudomonadales bacterium]
QQTSDDGGFGFNQVDRGGGEANANRIEAAFVFSDLFGEKEGSKEEVRGTFYIENREDGFSAPGRLTRGKTEKFGASATAPLNDDTELTLKLDDTSNDQSGDLSVVEINLSHSLNENWLIGAGLRADDREGTSIDSGAREDLALQMKYLSAEDWSLWGFTQATLHRDDERDRNHRAGVGGVYQIAEHAALNGEISAGDMGLGIVGGIDYQWSDRTSIYSNYQLDNDRTDNGARSRNGQFVFGVRNRWSDSANVYAEGRRLSGGQGSGLMQGYGINYAPTDAWSYGLGMEHGDINQEADNEIERLAITASMGYTDAGKRYSGILEYRDDKSDAEDRSVWLVRNNYSSQVSQDWRAIIHLDAAISESNLGDAFDADFAEGSLGYAYRPVGSDWLNALVKYTYLYDLAPDEQFSTTDVSTVDYAQRSQVIAGDVTVDLSPRWSLGGKYAYRLGELRPSRDDSADWFESKGELFILRADWHIVHAWDVTLEWRQRNEISANDSRDGWLVAGYRHFGKHFKAGVGYNFSNFSDDLTDLDYEAGGWFLNAVGKY